MKEGGSNGTPSTYFLLPRDQLWRNQMQGAKFSGVGHERISDYPLWEVVDNDIGLSH
jgi:hypothetical protein